MFRFVKCTRLLFFWVVLNSLAVQFNLLKGKKSFKQYLQHTDNFVDGSLSLVERRHDFKYVRMRFLALSPNSGNWRWHDMIMALIFSLGCLEIGTRRSKFSSTNRRTNICDLKKKTWNYRRVTWRSNNYWSIFYLSLLLLLFSSFFLLKQFFALILLYNVIFSWFSL